MIPAVLLTLTASLPLAAIRFEVRRDDADEQQLPAERAYFAAIRDTTDNEALAVAA